MSRPSFNLRTLLGIIAIGIQVGCTSCMNATVGNESAVTVMFDFSKTFAPYDLQDETAISQVGEMIVDAIKSGWLTPPVKVQWAAFGDQGLSPSAPCGPPLVLRPTLTPTQSTGLDSKVLHNVKQFEIAIGQCAKAVRALSHSAEAYTDVSGAMAFAAKAVAEAKTKRVVVIYSDLLEDLPSGRQPSTYDLAGDDVIVVWRPGLDDRRQPVEVQKRVEAASKAYRERGAARVCDFPVQSITDGDVMACLTKEK
jgi:hypothetical protein